MNNNFITFEGSDGAGKTTVLKRVFETLDTITEQPSILTREPGGNRISEMIRNVILDRNNREMDAKTEALLYAAARRQHLVETILPALADGKMVLSDRYLDSSLAYQGGGRQIGCQAVYEMNQFATDGLMPGLTIYFDVPVAVGLQRIAEHRSVADTDRLDVETRAFHQRVHDTYEQLVQKYPDRMVRVDATQPVEQVYESVMTILRNYLNRSDR
ncbi:dTMP kinase [Nicoliella spurrieriana]|uniref:Thymidylate kinase n=1 Tax=Nicoliella spurrieriana TaxID=2925830 RepID=A0A976X5K3_9LACO|nr:dTMP kinase [Nicoliella spurrieriana]UQS87000.1 dTMP kinase [Nicoliella spurrieriana]